MAELITSSEPFGILRKIEEPTADRSDPSASH